MASDQKLFVGGRLRRLRRDLGLTQTRMAEDLGVSPSYLNHLERNQRPVTAAVLLRLAEAYDIDVRALTAEADGPAADLAEVFADPLFRDLGLARHEIAEVAQNAPGVADAVLRLYQAYADRRKLADLGAAGEVEPGHSAVITPSDWVRDFIQGHRNFFPDLDERAEALAALLRPEPQGFFETASARLKAEHGVTVRIMPMDVLPDSVRRYDHHRRRLMLSDLLGASGRAFALAYQLAVFEIGDGIEAWLERAAPPDAPTRRLLKVSLANYVAGAILMPYGDFQATAEKTAYDIGLIRVRFGVGFEQACHRLTTLSRQTARGVPFFMLRTDSAGNVSKRFANGPSPFSRFGGACPRWNLHAAFRTPGRILTQIVESPDGARYFTLSRTVKRVTAPFSDEDTDLALGLGCELKHAHRLVYARGLDLANPLAIGVGPACRICERPACPQRAAEPVNRTLMVDDFTKSISPYPFAAG